MQIRNRRISLEKFLGNEGIKLARMTDAQMISYIRSETKKRPADNSYAIVKIGTTRIKTNIWIGDGFLMLNLYKNYLASSIQDLPNYKKDIEPVLKKEGVTLFEGIGKYLMMQTKKLT